MTLTAQEIRIAAVEQSNQYYEVVSTEDSHTPTDLNMIQTAKKIEDYINSGTVPTA